MYIFFQMVLWYSLMGDRNNWWLSLFSYFLLFTLDIFFLSSDPPSPPPKKNKFININIYIKKQQKQNQKQTQKIKLGKTLPKVQIGQTSSTLIAVRDGPRSTKKYSRKGKLNEKNHARQLILKNIHAMA